MTFSRALRLTLILVPKGTETNSEGLSLLSGITKDLYFWVSGNVPGDLYDDIACQQ
jgi:hypothetical protein